MTARFSTALIDKAHSRRLREQEETRVRTLERLRQAVERLPVSFDTAVAFGSVTRKGRFGPSSDIDLGVFGLADEHYFVAKRYLEHELSRDVDLIQLEHHRMRDTILKGGSVWKPKDS